MDNKFMFLYMSNVIYQKKKKKLTIILIAVELVSFHWFLCHYKKRSMELRLTKMQLQSRVWAVFYTNAAPPLDVWAALLKRSSTSAEAVFYVVQAAFVYCTA